jgi:hypothetical protein
MSLGMTAVENDTNPKIEFRTVFILKAKRAYQKISSLCCFVDNLNRTLNQLNLERKGRSHNTHNNVRVSAVRIGVD